MPTQEQINQLIRQHWSDTISAADKAYFDSINSLPPIEGDNTFNPYPSTDSLTAMVEADKAAEKATEAKMEQFLTNTGYFILYAVIFFFVFILVYQIIYQIRRAANPAYRERTDKEVEAYKQQQQLRKIEKAQERARKKRIRQAMSPEERQLRNIYWLLFWQGLSGRRRR